MFSSDIEKYNQLIKDAHNVDFYHLTEYILLEASRLNSNFVFFYGAGCVIPFLKRQFPYNELIVGDLTMAYGYCSPIYLDQNSVTFDSAYRLLSESNEYVSIFLKHSPFLEVSDIDNGNSLQIGNIRVIDLSIGYEKLCANFRKVHRRDINKSAQLGLVTTNKIFSVAQIGSFLDIYGQTMDRLNADQRYYFSHDYMNSLICIKGVTIRIVSTYCEGEAISSSLFILYGKNVHYYLSASLDHKLRGYASKLNISEAMNYACRYGFKYFNLGGGLGGKADTLHHFKKGFGGDDKALLVSRIVPDSERYLKMCKDLGEYNDDTFPKYRAEYNIE